MRFIIILLLSFGVFACSKKKTCYWDVMPNSLIFQLNHNGSPIPDDILNQVTLYYVEGGVKKYITDLGTSGNADFIGKGLLGTRNIVFQSGDHNVKTYYLEYANGYEVDTLYVDYSERSPSSNCVYALRQLKYNSQIALTDASLSQSLHAPVYVLNKQ